MLASSKNVGKEGRRWKDSPRARLLDSIDNTALLKKYITGLDRRQASILFQLQTGHIGLNQHLFRIRKSDTPVCPNCQELLVVESVKHFILSVCSIDRNDMCSNENSAITQTPFLFF